MSSANSRLDRDWGRGHGLDNLNSTKSVCIHQNLCKCKLACITWENKKYWTCVLSLWLLVKYQCVNRCEMWRIHEACQHLTGKKTAWRLVCVRELKMTWVNYPTSRADKNPEFLRRKLVSALLGLPLKHWVTTVLARCSIVMNISVQV